MPMAPDLDLNMKGLEEYLCVPPNLSLQFSVLTLHLQRTSSGTPRSAPTSRSKQRRSKSVSAKHQTLTLQFSVPTLSLQTASSGIPNEERGRKTERKVEREKAKNEKQRKRGRGRETSL
uniref:Uncharacterized protein n=1 Tax=Nelumbo nucifera TaxID=4432 RepID=A0A822XZU2_NELNU|nr:TPA_asm: hypothetical protein HUJ06_026195 [Nelumbo nucifera]